MFRRLTDHDRPALEVLLRRHSDSSIFIRSNIYRTGLTYADIPHAGQYVGHVLPNGMVTSVLAHYWNGNLMVQADDPSDVLPLISMYKEFGTRRVCGVLGPAPLAIELLKVLNYSDSDFAINRVDSLFGLDLIDLKAPAKKGCVVPWHNIEFELRHSWIQQYDMEALNAPLTQALIDRTAEEAADAGLERWGLIVDGDPVSMCGFNARLPDMVQIGPVWTPPKHRGQGYARALLYQVLSNARESGTARAVLFTNSAAAIRSYRALGFQRVADFRIALLREPLPLSCQTLGT